MTNTAIEWTQNTDGSPGRDPEIFSLQEIAALPHGPFHHGYVRVRVGHGHHLAHAGSAYALKHRVVAESKLQRRLVRKEIVHHLDGNPGNNEPGNLMVLPSHRHHGVEHRKPNSRATQPADVETRQIQCACGCGTLIADYDANRVSRRFAYGHHQRVQPAPVTTALLTELALGEVRTIAQLAVVAGGNERTVSTMLCRLAKRGLVRCVKRGRWIGAGNV